MQFYDKPVFHPGTGEALQPVTQAVFFDWKKSEEEKRQASEEATRAAATQTAVAAATKNAIGTNTPTVSPTARMELTPTAVISRQATSLEAVREKVNVGPFTVVLLGCEKKGSYVACTGTLTNDDSKDVQDLSFCGGGDYYGCYSRAFDEQGNEYPARKVKLGVREADDSSRIQMGQVPSGVPVRMAMAFVGYRRV